MNMNMSSLQTPTYIILPITSKNVQHAWEYLEELSDDRLIQASFPKGDIRSPKDFVDMALSSDNQTFIVFEHDHSGPVFSKRVGHFNLNAWNGKAAQMHFSVLRKLHGRGGIRMGRNVVQQILTMKAADGSQYVKNLIGYTPCFNKLACRYTLAAGFEKLTIVKDGYTLADGTICDAMLSIAR